MAYDINYNDDRFKEVEADKKAAINEVEKTYGGMINQSNDYFKAQIDASKEWADKQTQLQQEQTDFAIEKIEQQKDQAKKDYTREQSGAYTDWQKQKNDYGVNAEQQAASGLRNTGFSESSQVSMYNTYQNRVATARESYNNAVLNYNNAIKDARLQNNSALAEIAYKALQQQLELSLQGFQYKNQLLIEQANKKTEAENIYYGRYQDVLQQINTENALAEQIRQYNEQMALEREQFAWQKAQAEKASRSSGGGGGGGGGEGSPRVKSDSPQIEDDDNGSSNEAEINTASVLKLGEGPVSGEWLEQKEAEGKISSIVAINGQRYFKNNSTKNVVPLTPAISALSTKGKTNNYTKSYKN